MAVINVPIATTEVYKGAQVRIVNMRDVKKWEAAGWCTDKKEADAKDKSKAKGK